MSKPRSIASNRKLAEALDVSHPTVGRWLHHADWKFRRVPPWPQSDVPKILRWAADFLRQSVDQIRGDPALIDLRKQKLMNEIRRLLAVAETCWLANPSCRAM